MLGMKGIEGEILKEDYTEKAKITQMVKLKLKDHKAIWD